MRLLRFPFVLAALLLLSLRLPAAYAQETPAAVNAVVAAFARGDARALAAEAAERIDVSLPGGTSVYSRAQARLIFDRFFSTTPARGFRVEHRMRSDGAYFATGRYVSAEGQYTVLLRFGTRGEAWELREVHVEPHGLE